MEERGSVGVVVDELAVVTGTPHVQAVPTWVARPLAQFAWTEHGLLWTYVKRGKSPEVHGARCALAWIGGVFDVTPATGEVAAPTQLRAQAELIICNDVAQGLPYPDSEWWLAPELSDLDTPQRRRWWTSWASYGWTQCIAEGAGLGLAWALYADEPTPPVTPHRLEDGTQVPAEVREDCRRALVEASLRPMPALGRAGAGQSSA